MPLTREQIMERLEYKSLSLTTSRQNFFSSDVPEKVIRYIVAIFIIGDGSASRTVDIEKVKEDDTYDMIFNDVPIAPSDVRPIPPSYDIENPIIKLNGGTNLSAVANAGTPKVTIIYWDDIVG